MKTLVSSVLTVTAFTVLTASAAQADCITGGQKSGRSPLQVLRHPSVTSYDSAPVPEANSTPASIVGLWAVTFLFGNGPDVFDHGFELWHADGTELTIDVAVPPAAGNICVGVWEKTGPRSVKR